MNVVMTKKRLTISCIVLVSVGVMLGYGLRGVFESSSDTVPVQHKTSSQHSNGVSEKPEKKVLYWYDPMYPQQQFDQPGPSPFMDMDLVPRYADSGSDNDSPATGVRVDASMRQSLGMRTAPVRNSTVLSQLVVTGQVTFNERAITRLQHPRAAYVESVWPLAPGDQVEKGQPLVRLRTPEWTAAQFELLALLQTEDPALVSAGKERARSLGMPPSLISAVITKKTVQEDWIVRAPITGVVRSLDVRAGMTLPAGAPLLQINRLDSVWVLVSVPQSQSQQVARGDIADVYIDGVSSPKRQGHIAEILPLLDSASRNVSLRIELENRQGDLRPGLSARVTLHGSEVSHHEGMAEMLVVPTEALIRTGTRTVVMISAGDGLFQPVEVRTGAEKGAVTVIEAGLEDGDRVVVSGQFLLDSEASLQGIPVRLLNDEAPSSHHSHEHSAHEPPADESSSEGSQP